jgi:hypothetical protein
MCSLTAIRLYLGWIDNCDIWHWVIQKSVNCSKRCFSFHSSIVVIVMSKRVTYWGLVTIVGVAIVGVATRLWGGESRFWIPLVTTDLSYLQNVNTSSLVHIHSPFQWVMEFFSRRQAAGALIGEVGSYSVKIKKVCVGLFLSDVPSWKGEGNCFWCICRTGKSGR